MTSGAAPTAPPSPVPPAPPNRIVAAGVYYGWLAALASLAVVILNADLVLGAGAVRAALRLVFGSVLFLEGGLLATDWQRARTLLLTRLLRRAHRHHGAFRIGRAWWMRAGATILTLVGIVMLGAGLFDLLRGAIDAIDA